MRDYGCPPLLWDADPDCAHVWGPAGHSGQRLRNGQGPTGLEGGRDLPAQLHPSTGATCARCNAWQGSLGLEPIIALYVAHLVQIFAAVQRVLRPDGILFVNIADTMRHKSLCLIPQRLAIALADDGWIVRQVFPWIKVNGMPNSQTDRPTSALEWWLMCTQQPRYYSDLESVRREASRQQGGNVQTSQQKYGNGTSYGPSHKTTLKTPLETRTYRNTDLWFHSLTPPYGLVGVGEELVGLDVPTQPGPAGHYATFSPDLVEPLLRLATSPKGCCGVCGAPVRRVVDRQSFGKQEPSHGKYAAQEKNGAARNMVASVKAARATGQAHDHPFPAPSTRGWERTCLHVEASTAPCTVLDCFAGRGSTLLAAQRLGLHGVGIELRAADVHATRQRLTLEAPLLALIREGSTA